jgi:ATP synthase protein I
MSATPDPAKLKELEEKLAKARRAQEPEGRKHYAHEGAAQAWRMIIELVTGMGVGFAIGYGLDTLFGTLPLFLVIFCLLGFAAGVRVMMQTAREVQKEDEKRRGERNG